MKIKITSIEIDCDDADSAKVAAEMIGGLFGNLLGGLAPQPAKPTPPAAIDLSKIKPTQARPAVTVDAALGGIYDVIGELIKSSGMDDSSGLRRCLLQYLDAGDFNRFSKNCPCSREQFDALRQLEGSDHD